MAFRSLVLAGTLVIALQGGCAPRGGSQPGTADPLGSRHQPQGRHLAQSSLGGAHGDPPRERQDLRVTLDNGLRLFLRPARLARVAALHAFVDYGTADEPEDLPGLAHLFEHLLLRGPPGHPVARLAAEVETAGGQLSAWTTPDQTVFRVVLPSRELPQGLALLAEALRRPALDLATRRHELRAIADEIHEAEAQPARLLSQALLRGAFPDHPYRRPVLGAAQSLAELARPNRARSAPTLADLFTGAYTAERITVVLTGDFDPGATRPLLQEAFSGIPRGGKEARRARLPGTAGRKDGPRIAAYEHSGEQVHLGLALPMPGARASAESLAAAALGAAVLGQGEGARLQAEMSSRGLSGEVSAALFAPRDGGLLLVTAALGPAQLGEAAQLLLGEVRRLAREDVPAAELDRARDLLLTDAAYGIETPAGLGRRLGFFATLAAEGEAAYERALRDMTPERLRALLLPFLQREALTLAALLPRPGSGSGAAPASSKGRGDGRRQGQRRAQVLLQAVTPADPAETERLLRAAIARAAQAETSSLGAGGTRLTQRSQGAQEGEVVRHRLRGGGTLLLLPEHGVPTVALRALWPGGLRFEDERSAGANHLLGKLLVSGSRHGGCSQAEMAALGGSIEAQTGPDSFGLRAQVLSQHAGRGLQIVLDCLRRPALPEAEVEAERRRTLAALRHREDADLGEAALRLFLRALFPRHSYRLDPLGTEASVATLSRRRLLEFYRRHYGPERLTLAVVGDVDPALVIARVEAALAPRPSETQAGSETASAEGAPQVDPPPQAPVQVFLPLPRGQQQAHLLVGFRGLSVKDPDRHALEVLRTILRGGADEGRLGRALQDRRGLVVQVGERSLTGLDAGYVGFSLSTFPDRAEAAQAALRDELRRLVDHPVTAEELSRAKRYLIGAHEMGLQRRDQVAAALSQSEAFGLGWAAYRSIPEAIARVEVQDVRRVARRVLNEGRMVLAAVLPESLTPAAGRRLVEKAPAPGAGPPPPRSNPPLSKVPIKSPGKKARRKLAVEKAPERTGT